MAKSKKKRRKWFFWSAKRRAITTTPAKKPGGEKLSVKKYCPRLRKHTEHTEKKK